MDGFDINNIELEISGDEGEDHEDAFDSDISGESGEDFEDEEEEGVGLSYLQSSKALQVIFIFILKWLFKGPVEWEKSYHVLLIFGKFMENGAFFVFTTSSESL